LAATRRCGSDGVESQTRQVPKS